MCCETEKVLGMADGLDFTRVSRVVVSQFHFGSSQFVECIMAEEHSAQAIAALAKRCFEASQVLEPSDRAYALERLRQGLSDAKQEILQANIRDMEVCQCLLIHESIS
jgi:malate/lactate dehydrogenase